MSRHTTDGSLVTLVLLVLGALLILPLLFMGFGMMEYGAMMGGWEHGMWNGGAAPGWVVVFGAVLQLGFLVTLVGREADFEGTDAALPDDVEVELVSTGPYSPEAEGVFADLTDRQREILETALRFGYYETPREATLEDLAPELGVEAGTVGKHLRAVESKVFAKYVR